jgi:hypothetical protein
MFSIAAYFLNIFKDTHSKLFKGMHVPSNYLLLFIHYLMIFFFFFIDRSLKLVDTVTLIK